MTEPQTPEPQTLPTPAPLWRRTLAFLVDVAVLLPLLVGLAWVWQRLFEIQLPAERLPLFDWVVQLHLQDDPLVPGGVLVGALVAGAYFGVGWLLWGTSVGMRLLGLGVVDGRHGVPGPAAATTRVLGAGLSAAYLGLGFVWILFDAHRQGFHDKIAGTYVVRIKGR